MGKKKGISIPSGKNGYLERKKAEIRIYRQAEKETHIQFMTDMLVLTLNDPDVMGKDSFGKKRLLKIIEAWGKKYDQYHPALENSDESDYYQMKLDEHLRMIFGEDMEKFGARYPWVIDHTY